MEVTEGRVEVFTYKLYGERLHFISLQDGGY